MVLYVFALYCDECGALLNTSFQSKLEGNKWLKQHNGYAHEGVHLCENCNQDQIKRNHLHAKRDRF